MSQDINSFLNNLYASNALGPGASGGNQGSPTENKGDIKRVVHNMGIMATGGLLPFNLGSALEHGGIQQGLERGLATDGMVNAGGKSFSINSTLGSLFAAILDLKNMFNGVTAAQIAVAEVSPADLGTFSPTAGPSGMAIGGEMGAGAPSV